MPAKAITTKPTIIAEMIPNTLIPVTNNTRVKAIKNNKSIIKLSDMLKINVVLIHSQHFDILAHSDLIGH